MQAIEFEANAENGIVRIPETYKNWYNRSIRVILLRETQTKAASDASHKQELMNFFNRFDADLSGYRFDRDEANKGLYDE